MNTYTIKEGQTLLDVALQVYGSVDYLVKLCYDNTIELNEDLAGGTKLLYDVELFNLSPISNKLQLNSVFIATAGALIANTQPLLIPLLEHSTEEHTPTEHN